jgi:hypothetical protein
MFKEFLMKKLIASKLKGMPQEQQDKILTLVTKNPKLFEEIAIKIKKKMDSGVDQTKASMSVMMEYKDQIQKIMKDEGLA